MGESGQWSRIKTTGLHTVMTALFLALRPALLSGLSDRFLEPEVA